MIESMAVLLTIAIFVYALKDMVKNKEKIYSQYRAGWYLILFIPIAGPLVYLTFIEQLYNLEIKGENIDSNVRE